eukprot:TRINITY_DN11844_c0_g1_i1.p1 TRINITY_DN11844_c0_g1~~TRINITY_DN11844_c0_g1_i1.p1  ORF type:complete len:588 (-),score=88.54 TRINITY_DN11844_c0_g1_i1:35-1705(-)
MIGQQNLRESQNALQTSMERLSSGLRINSAKDDAAGQAIANRMSSQITGLAQAQRNSNDGISVAQTAEGGLDQVNDNLQRIRELSVQAQNGTNSADDLDSIQDEINQRLGEIDRISEQTDFNGTKVLASDNGLKIQVGADDGQTIEVNLKQINAETLGLKGFNINASGTPNSKAATQDLAANGFTQVGTTNEYTNATFNTASTVGDVFQNLEDGATIKETASGSTYTYDKAAGTFSADRTDVKIDGSAGAQKADLGLTPSAGETNTLTVEMGGETQKVNVSSSGALSLASTGESLYLSGTGGTKELSVTDTGGNGVATMEDLATELAARDSAGTPALAASITTADGTVYSTSTSTDATLVDVSNEIVAAEDLQTQMEGDVLAYTGSLDGSATAAKQFAVDAANAVTVNSAASFTSGFEGDFTLSAAATASVYVNDNGKITDGAANEIYANEDGKLSLEAVSGSDKTENPLEALDAALSQVDSLRSELGAVQNRFESAITNLSTNQTNLSAARSRIEDADYAVEVADMTRAQILQQAGTSVLAQANQLPQNVLSLLG